MPDKQDHEVPLSLFSNSQFYCLYTVLSMLGEQQRLYEIRGVLKLNMIASSRLTQKAAAIAGHAHCRYCRNQ